MKDYLEFEKPLRELEERIDKLAGSGSSKPAVEEEIRKRNGVWLVIETSDTEHYAPARRLYERCGYTLAMLLQDFYHDSDGMCTYTKRLR